MTDQSTAPAATTCDFPACVHPDHVPVGCPGEDQRDALTAAPCAFCAIAAGTEPADVLWAWPDAIAIRPLNPVTDGHTLVLPVQHVRDAAEDPDVTAAVMRHAAALCHRERPANLITSIGLAATQTVFHLHIHIVPRTRGDGLALPWTGQNGATQ